MDDILSLVRMKKEGDVARVSNCRVYMMDICDRICRRHFLSPKVAKLVVVAKYGHV